MLFISVKSPKCSLFIYKHLCSCISIFLFLITKPKWIGIPKFSAIDRIGCSGCLNTFVQRVMPFLIQFLKVTIFPRDEEIQHVHSLGTESFPHHSNSKLFNSEMSKCFVSTFWWKWNTDPETMRHRHLSIVKCKGHNFLKNFYLTGIIIPEHSPGLFHCGAQWSLMPPVYYKPEASVKAMLPLQLWACRGTLI